MSVRSLHIQMGPTPLDESLPGAPEGAAAQPLRVRPDQDTAQSAIPQEPDPNQGTPAPYPQMPQPSTTEADSDNDAPVLPDPAPFAGPTGPPAEPAPPQDEPYGEP